jgi:outer membrane protein TolC
MENMQRQSIRKLSALVGSDIEGALLTGQLESNATAPDFHTLLEGLWANSPELIAARAKVQSDKYTVRREKAERISDITIEGGAGYNFEADQTVAAAGVSFPIKIFDRNQGTIQQAQADLARQCAEVKRLQEKLRRDLSAEYQQYLTSAQHIEQYQQLILPELKETYRLLLESYKDNRTNWNEVLHAQSDYFGSRNEYFDWLAKFRHSEVMIDGMLLSGGLMAAEGTTPGGHIDAAAKPR